MFTRIAQLLIAATFSLIATTASAEPAPFGLTIGKTTVSDLNRFPYTVSESAHHWGEGAAYKLDTLPKMDGLVDVEMTFDHNQVLQSVAAEFAAEKYAALLNLLQSKYRLVDNSIPFHGSRYAVLEDGQTRIYLEAPHMHGGSVSLSYINKMFLGDLVKVK